MEDLQVGQLASSYPCGSLMQTTRWVLSCPGSEGASDGPLPDLLSSSMPCTVHDSVHYSMHVACKQSFPEMLA